MNYSCFSLLGLVLIAITLRAAPELDAAKLVGTSAEDVTLTEYNATDASPVAEVHATRLFRDFERRGFFRIGLLPIPIAENVQIQIQSADCLSNALMTLNSWDEPPTAVRRLELRKLEIKLFGEKQPRLSASTGHVGQNGVLELSKVSLFNVARPPTFISNATLQIAGSSPGWLHWNSDGHPQNTFLFKPSSDKTP